MKRKCKTKFVIVLMLLLTVYSLSSAVAQNFLFKSEVSTDATIATIDKFGNCYLASRNKLLKYSPSGEFLYPYEEFRYGAIGSVDVTNPLKIVVFFPDVMKAVTLDKFLSPLTVYDFLQLGYPTVSAVCGSTDGRIWYFDNIRMQLKKIDETGRVLREGQPLNAILAKTPVPNFLLEYDNMVYMNDSSQGIFVFDVFGSYKKTIPVKGLTKFQALAQTIIYSDKQNLNAYDMLSFGTRTLELPAHETDLLQAVIGKEVMLMLEPGTAKFYSVKQ